LTFIVYRSKLINAIHIKKVLFLFVINFIATISIHYSGLGISVLSK